MAIYEPVFDGSGVYGGGIGKDAPYGKATGLYKPSIVRPGGGRTQAIIQGGKYVYDYFRRYPSFGPRVVAVVGGHVVSSYAKSNQRDQTLRDVFKSNGRSKYYRKSRNYTKRSSNCCCKPVRCRRRFSNKQRFY